MDRYFDFFTNFIAITIAQIRNAQPPIIPVGMGPIKGLTALPSVKIKPAEAKPFKLP